MLTSLLQACCEHSVKRHTRSLLRVIAENANERRNLAVIRGSSRLGGGDVAVIIPDERSVCDSIGGFSLCAGADFINSLTDNSFLLIRSVGVVGVLFSSLMEFDNSLISSST